MYKSFKALHNPYGSVQAHTAIMVGKGLRLLNTGLGQVGEEMMITTFCLCEEWCVYIN